MGAYEIFGRTLELSLKVFLELLGSRAQLITPTLSLLENMPLVGIVVSFGSPAAWESSCPDRLLITPIPIRIKLIKFQAVDVA
jgi:hypothetical protein